MGRRGWHQQREPGPPQQQWEPQRAPRQRLLRHENHSTDSLLESGLFPAMVCNRKCSQSKDKWRKLYGPLGQWCPGKYHHAKVCKWSFTAGRANCQVHRFQSHLCGARQCIHKTVGLCCDPGSGRWVQSYDEDKIALVIPDLSNFMAQIPVILGTPTISWIVNMIKEVEVDALVILWENARVVHLLSVCRMMPMEVGDGQRRELIWMAMTSWCTPRMQRP